MEISTKLIAYILSNQSELFVEGTAEEVNIVFDDNEPILEEEVREFFLKLVRKGLAVPFNWDEDEKDVFHFHLPTEMANDENSCDLQLAYKISPEEYERMDNYERQFWVHNERFDCFVIEGNIPYNVKIVNKEK